MLCLNVCEYYISCSTAIIFTVYKDYKNSSPYYTTMIYVFSLCMQENSLKTVYKYIIFRLIYTGIY